MAGDYTVRQLADAAYGAGFRGPALITAVAISLAEDPQRKLRAVNHNANGTTDRGPWQINSVHGLAGNPYDLTTNAHQAFVVYQGAHNQFTPWVTYNNGAYKLQERKAGKAVIGTSVSHDATTVVHLPGDSAQAAVGKGARDVVTAATAIPKLIGHLLSPDFWKMVGLGFLALTLILIGMVILIESNKTIRGKTIQAGEVAALA